MHQIGRWVITNDGARPRKSVPYQCFVSKRRIIERDHGRCIYCGKAKPGMHVDHVVPASSGGGRHADNLVTACGSCNQQKHNKRCAYESIILSVVAERNRAFGIDIASVATW